MDVSDIFFAGFFPGGRAEGPEGCLWRTGEFFLGGGLNFFWGGRNIHQGRNLD